MYANSENMINPSRSPLPLPLTPYLHHKCSGDWGIFFYCNLQVYSRYGWYSKFSIIKKLHSISNDSYRKHTPNCRKYRCLHLFSVWCLLGHQHRYLKCILGHLQYLPRHRRCQLLHLLRHLECLLRHRRCLLRPRHRQLRCLIRYLKCHSQQAHQMPVSVKPSRHLRCRCG